MKIKVKKKNKGIKDVEAREVLCSIIWDVLVKKGFIPSNTAERVINNLDEDFLQEKELRVD